MIEIIRAYNGYPRPEGRVKQTFTPMYRCTKCETIKPTFKELKSHPCNTNQTK